MSNIYNPKQNTQNWILNNIKFIKIIAIILGILIITGVTILFFGLMNSYKNLETSKKIDQNFENNKKEIKIFNFLQPKNAQLISTSLGINNQILLRFIYKGDNVLVLLDSSSKEVSSIITLKKELDKW